jgi:hypothetical protein
MSFTAESKDPAGLNFNEAGALKLAGCLGAKDNFVINRFKVSTETADHLKSPFRDLGFASCMHSSLFHPALLLICNLQQYQQAHL